MANEFKIKKGLIVTGASGGTVVDIQGSQGQLFSVTDNLSGSIFAVSDISGVPIFDVNSSGLSTFDGLVSGITPVNAANFATKAYVDGSIPSLTNYVTLNTAQTITAIKTFTENVVVTGAEIFINTDTAGSSLTWRESDSSITAGQLRGYANRGDIYLYDSGVKKTELSSQADSFIPALHIGGTTAATGGVLQVTGNATFTGSITTTSVSGISIDTGGNAILTLDGASGSTEAIIFKHSGTEVSRISHSNSTNLIFSTGSSVTTALTLDTSQNATFAGDVFINRTGILGSAKLSIQADAGEDVFGVQCNSLNTTTKLINVFNSGGVDIASITINNDYTPDMLFNVDNGAGAITEVLKLDSLQNATFAGDVDVNGGQLKIQGDFAKLLFEDTAGTDLDSYIVNNANGLFFGKTNSPSSANDILSLNLSTKAATFTGLVSGITPVNAANFVTKAYVDGSGGGTGPFLPLAGGTMTGNTRFSDTVQLQFGTGNDMRIFHTPGSSYIENITGDLYIKTANVLRLNSSSNESMITASPNGAVVLYYNNSEKLKTTNTGVTVTGNGIFTGNVGIGTTTPQTKLQVAGGIQMADDTDTASAAKVGTMRYRTGTEYVDVTGTDLVTNGDFATDTNWTKGTGVTIASGVGTWTNTANNVGLTQLITFTANAYYRCNVTVSNYSSGSFRFRYPGISSPRITANGTYSLIIQANQATNDTLYLQGETNGDANVNFSIDNVSVVEVTAEDASYADMCMQTGASTYEWVNIVRNTY